MTHFDNKLAKKIQEEAVLALEKVAKKYGVTIKNNGGTLGENDFTMKMKVEVVGVVKKYDDYIFAAFELPNDIIGKKFSNRGINFTITELNTRAPKFPVIAKGDDGKSYKFPSDTVKRLLKIK